MVWVLLLFTVVPLVAFVVVERRFGLQAGVLTALFFGGLFVIFEYYLTGDFDKVIIVDMGLLFIMGGLSIWLQNSSFFKFQPFIILNVGALYMIYLRIFEEPFVFHLKPLMLAASPESAFMFDDPRFIQYWHVLDLHCIFLLAICGFITGYAALKMSNMAWLVSRMLIYPLGILMAIVDSYLYLR